MPLLACAPADKGFSLLLPEISILSFSILSISVPSNPLFCIIGLKRCFNISAFVGPGGRFAISTTDLRGGGKSFQCTSGVIMSKIYGGILSSWTRSYGKVGALLALSGMKEPPKGFG